ncbi:autophagy-related protein 9A-like [Limulus polyphemus]|uniref:Autophagy-related protein 9 n=1 Tax=Limulus polyphemus TaxID=6850 RepID=A0ABM1SG39_LIMPO|nr:autophagy-related protein 9A-like [Limulus polyphemus]
MTTPLQTGYQALTPYNDSEADTPQEGGMLIHVVPDSAKSRWNHIEDLDSFFTRVYHYHQKHGFSCMMLQEVLELIQFIFVVMFSVFLMECVEYSVLFKDVQPKHNITVGNKITLADAIVPAGQCIAGFSPTIVICLLVSLVFWLLRVVKVVYHFFQYMEIRAFYSSALKITAEELDSMTWHEVQQKLLEVQTEQQMCIHKSELSELDIYHRILRFKNYMISMMNKDLLPLKFNLPVLGEVVFLTKGLKYNLEMILFWGPWAPFENSWHLKEDFKKVGKRKEVAKKLSKHILWIGLANFLLCPIVLLWQVLYSFFNYAEVIKHDPSVLGARRWSHYGRLYLRHFNELDHELNARYDSPFSLKKSEKFSQKCLLAAIETSGQRGETLVYHTGVCWGLEMMGSSEKEILKSLADYNIVFQHLVWCPEKLMLNILAHIHYIPDHWKGRAHMYKVRDEFAQLFQYKAAYLIEELLSPIITPFILCFYLRHRAMDIVDFYRNFTVDVVGVGDVCSFAQMDVRRHGHPYWMSDGQTQANQYEQAENGKTELSLMHFTLTNPNWIPPEQSHMFLNNLKELGNTREPFLDRILIGDENWILYANYADLVNSILHPLRDVSSTGPGTSFYTSDPKTSGAGFPRTGGVSSTIRGGLNQAEGPLHSSQAGLLASIHPTQTQVDDCTLPLHSSQVLSHEVPLELTAVNMSLSTMYMHELHSRTLRHKGITASNIRTVWQRPLVDMPEILESPQEGQSEQQDEEQPLLVDTRIVRSS